MEPITDKELKEYRYLFPVTKKWIYLNHAGVAPISLRVHDAVMKFNAESLHEGYTAGPRWVKHIDKVRQLAAHLIGALPEEMAFVKNTSHGLSLLSEGLDFQVGDEVIISELEFPANVYPWMALAEKGVVVKKLPSKGSAMDLTQLPELITARTRVVSLSSVTFNTGFRVPLSEVGRLCREKGVLFCVDAIQSLGAFEINVVHDHIDVLSADAHKWLLGPEGIGVFFIRKNLLNQVRPVLWGWNNVAKPLDFDHIDFKLHPEAKRYEEGSHNAMGIYALGAALELIEEIGVPRITERLMKLTQILIDGLQELGLRVTNVLDDEHRSGSVLADMGEDSDPKKLSALNDHLLAHGVYASVRGGRLRLSPHFYNTESEMAETLKILSAGLKEV